MATQSLNNSRRSGTELEKFKSTKIEYPKLRGYVRLYLTFERDLETIVKEEGDICRKR